MSIKPWLTEAEQLELFSDEPFILARSSGQASRIDSSALDPRPDAAQMPSTNQRPKMTRTKAIAQRVRADRESGIGVTRWKRGRAQGLSQSRRR